MAETDSAVPLPTHVEDAGWTFESSSRDQPTAEAILASVSETAADEATTEPAADAGASDAGADEATEASAEDAAAAEEPEQPRASDGKYAKKESAAERKGRLQAEFNALTRQRRDEERQLDALRRERAELEAKAPKPDAAVVDKPKSETAKPTWAAFEAEGKTWDEYQDARDEWIRADTKAEAERAWDARQKTEAQKADEAQAKARAEQVTRSHVERIEKARADHPDFDEVVASLGETDVRGEPLTPQTPFLRDAVIHHDQGHEILYYLGKHPDQCRALADLPLTNSMMVAVRETTSPTELLAHFAEHPADVRRIAQLSPASALVALGRITAQLEGAKNGSPTPAPSVTKAKPPIRPVGGSRGAVTEKRPEDLDFGPEYIRKMNEAEARAR